MTVRRTWAVICVVLLCAGCGDRPSPDREPVVETPKPPPVEPWPEETDPLPADDGSATPPPTSRRADEEAIEGLIKLAPRVSYSTLKYLTAEVGLSVRDFADTPLTRPSSSMRR